MGLNTLALAGSSSSMDAFAAAMLAYLGRSEIAQSLSQVALTEIVAVVLAYALKSLAENLSKHNNWPDKPAQTKEEDNIGISD